jgi:hypothetical protein
MGYALGTWTASVGQDPASPRVDGRFVSGDFFSTLGVVPFLWRTLTVADDVRGGGGPIRSPSSATVFGSSSLADRATLSDLG